MASWWIHRCFSCLFDRVISGRTKSICERLDKKNEGLDVLLGEDAAIRRHTDVLRIVAVEYGFARVQALKN